MLFAADTGVLDAKPPQNSSEPVGNSGRCLRVFIHLHPFLNKIKLLNINGIIGL